MNNPVNDSEEGFSSVSEWVQQLKGDDSVAARKIWERYWGKLVEVAKRQIGNRRRQTADEEDIAQEAFNGFFRAAAEGKFPRLHDRHDLWQLLLQFADNRLLDRWKHNKAQKRGGGNIRFESNGSRNSSRAGINAVPALDPTPEIAAELREQVEVRLRQLNDETLQEIAMLKLQGYSNQEIASRLNVVADTIGRKLNRIRKCWSDCAN